MLMFAILIKHDNLFVVQLSTHVLSFLLDLFRIDILIQQIAVIYSHPHSEYVFNIENCHIFTHLINLCHDMHKDINNVV